MRNQKEHKWAVFRNTVVVALGGLLFGYDTGVIGGSQLYFTEYFQLTPAEQGWAVSSALYGCLMGAGLAGYLTRSISRKFTLVISAFLFVVSAWGSGMADSLTTLVVYRVIGGLGVGLASMAAPMYIAEISPPKDRGRMVSLYQLAVVIGFFVVFLATYLIGGGNVEGQSSAGLSQLHEHNVTHSWRVMFWSELVPAIAFFVLLFFVPHSPRWLMLKNRSQDAYEVLITITGSQAEAKTEISNIANSLTDATNHKFITLFTRSAVLVTTIGIVLSVLQQVTGINAILYYGAEIFSNALGYGPEDALKQQLWLGAVNLVFTFVAIYCVDSWGRKPLLIVGSLGMFIGLSTLALTIYLQQKGVVSLIGILIFIGSFALSLGPVVWVLLSEIFPNSIRSAAMSIAVAAQWLSNAIVANVFPVINSGDMNAEIFNGTLPYCIFSVFCIVTVMFVYKYVPETKGKTLEELESLWHVDDDVLVDAKSKAA